MATDKLLQEFPPVSTQSWEEAIRNDLKGADYARKLIWQTEEGLAVKPYYRAEDIHRVGISGCRAGRFSLCAQCPFQRRLAHSRKNRRGRS